MGWHAPESIDVRLFDALREPVANIVGKGAVLTRKELTRAAAIGARLETFKGPWPLDRWRLLRCLNIFQTSRCDGDRLNRIHQFTRCIEGLIAPDKQGTTGQFKGTTGQSKSRTELFVGPRHHPLMGELYEVRSHIEHLHEYRYLAQFDRATRIRLAALEAVSEGIARDCLARILLDDTLLGHFGSVNALGRFWAMTPDERRAIWGEPINPFAPLDGFRFDWLSNEILGARP